MSLLKPFQICQRNTRIPFLIFNFEPVITLRALCTQNALSDQKPVKKKTVPIPKITLISDSLVSVTTMEEAQKLSKRRDMKLVKIVDLDSKTQRPVYKLMTGNEYHQEELKQREMRKKQKSNNFIKGEKLVFLKDNINEHDLDTYCKKILKWLAKSYQVNILINGSQSSNDKLVSGNILST